MNVSSSWFKSKKVWMTKLGMAVVSVCAFLALHDTNPRRQMIYGVVAAINGALAANYVSQEAKTDAAAVRLPDAPIIANQNNETPLVKPDEPTYSG